MFLPSRQLLYDRASTLLLVAVFGAGETALARMEGTASTLVVSIASTPTVAAADYDTNRNGLIEISSLEQLNAIRWDLDGNGVPTRAGATSYTAAFPNTGGVVCRTTTGVVSCKGYELVSDLDFNTGDPDTRTDDLYYNNGAGWDPIGDCGRWSWCSAPDGYVGTFRGNGHVIRNLLIRRPDERYVGLFGYLGDGSRIEGVGLRGARVEGDDYVGGLAGQAGLWRVASATIISTSYVMVSTSHVTGVVSGDTHIGGLVGQSYGEIAASYATGTVSGTNAVGGLVGFSYGEITASYAMGKVSGTDAVGGLAGANQGEIVTSYATGTVNGRNNVGGLAGGNVFTILRAIGQIKPGKIAASYATGAVRGTNNVAGGLVGLNWGQIAASYATGAVSGADNAGGLVGHNNGKITVSYATGAIRGTDDIGGLAGYNSGKITASYATGMVRGEHHAGGFVGLNYAGDIAASYATGAVSGTDDVGGLVGHNNGKITTSYATGAIRGTDDAGGLVGWNFFGKIAASYWDTLTSGLGSSAGGTGKKTFELRSPTTYTGIYAAWNVDVDGDGAADAPWDFGTEIQYPTLRYGHGDASMTSQQPSQPVISADSSLRGLSVGGATLSPDFRAAVTLYRAVSEYDVVTVTAMVADAGARARISPRDAQSDVGGHQVRLATGAASTVTVTVTAADGSATEYVVIISHEDDTPVFDVAATTLTYVAGTLVDETLPSARGGDGELRYALTDAGLTDAGSTPTRTLTLPSGLEFDTVTRRLHGQLTTASSTSRYTLTATDGDNNLSPSDAARTSIAIVVLRDHDANRNGLIEVSSLEQLNAIRWDLDGDGVPTKAGAASYAAAFPSADGIVCRTTTGVVSCKGYELVSDLDFNTGAASTRTDDLYYNNGAGWKPIGVYAATFRGNGHVIDNLFIQRPSESHVGLFSYLSIGSRIEGVGLRDVGVVGKDSVGGLAGQAGDRFGSRNTVVSVSIISSYATGTVSGANRVGGLVGSNGIKGEITASYAMGAVGGSYHVGGLVGTNSGGGGIAVSYATCMVSGKAYVGGLVGTNYRWVEIATSYATGVVSGTLGVGGLVGVNIGEITASYATGAVGGTLGVGGLVGSNRGEIAASYATGAVGGGQLAGGLVGLNLGEITTSYAMGAISGTLDVGGLVGSGSGGKIAASYATGAVSGVDNAGGLVGWGSGETAASYWDTLASGLERSAVGTGKKTFELRSPTTYTGIYTTWNVDVNGDGAADTPWDFGTETQYPILRYGHGTASVALQQPAQPVISADSSLRGLSVGGATLSPDFRAAVTLYDAEADRDVVTVTAWVADAGARAEISPRDAQSDVDGHQVRLAAIGVVSTVTVTVTAADGSATRYVVAISHESGAPVFDVAATTLTYVAGALVDETLPAARGGDGELRYALTDRMSGALTDVGVTQALAPMLTLPLDLEFDAATRRLHGRLTTASSTSRYTLTATDSDGNVSPSDAARMFIAIVVLPMSDYDANRNGLIEVSSLEQLNAIRWDLDGDGVPTRTSAASYAAAFADADGIVCHTTTGVVSCKGYELVSDLDFNTGDASTRTDDLYHNNGAGWEPVGVYAATFRGNDYVIRNLFIRRPGEDRIGLFGYLADGGRIEGVGLRDVSVVGKDDVGGLVGRAGAQDATGTVVIASYATGTVLGEDRTGVLVGRNSGRIAASYATGAVNGTWDVGGFVGRNSGEITAGYAMGEVGGQLNMGGLVGANSWGGTIAASYAAGTVGGADNVSGLVGTDPTSGGVSVSYWDTMTSGLERSAGGTGKRTFELRSPTTYTGIYTAWNVDVDGDETADAPWDFGTETQYPTLRHGHGTASVALQRPLQPVISSDSSLRGLSLGGATLSPDFRAAVTSYRAVSEYDLVTVTASVADAGARVEISPADAQSDVDGHQVRLTAGATGTVSVTVTAADGSATEYVVMVSHEGAAPTPEDTAPVFDVAATTLTYVAGALMDETLPAARGGNGELRYTLTDRMTGALTNVGVTQTLVPMLTLPPGLEFDAATRRLHGRLTTASSTSRYTLTATDGDDNVSPADAARMFITIVVLPVSDHDTNRNGLIEISSLEQLNAIRWDLDGDGVPTRTGVASYAAAFPNAGGVVCRTTTGVVSCKGYELISDLDFNTGAASTRTDDLYYNNGAGWEPIGTCGVSSWWCYAPRGYAATFRGHGHVIDNLFIRRPGEDHIGLFGYLADGSRIEGVGLRDVSVVGKDGVGGLAGQAGERYTIRTTIVSIVSSYATGTVSGTNHVGGLMGSNGRGGEITASYAAGAVSGTGRNIGGLVGYNGSYAEIATSYATGVVSGTSYVGGLVGVNHNGGEIAACYATGAVSGIRGAGGLVGGNGRYADITASYATGAVSGIEGAGGLAGINAGEIAASYATGVVRGTNNGGGLVGRGNGQWSSKREIASYWDTLTSGLGSSFGGTGKKTFELRSPTTYTGIYAAWNVDVSGDDVADAPWDFGTETQYPTLRYGHGTASVALQQPSQPVISADSSLRGLSLGGARLSPDFRAAVTSYDAAVDRDVVTVTALATDAGARAEISPRDAQSDVDGHQVRLAAGATGTVTVTVTVTAADGSATEYVVMVSHEGAAPTPEDTAPVFDVAATTLTYVAGALVDETLPAAHGGNGELRYTLTDGLTDAGSTPKLALPPGLEFDAPTRRLHGRLTTASSTSRYTLTATDGDDNVSPADAARMFITIVVLRDHDANRNGLIEISSLEQLNAIRWDLDGDGVPTRAGAASYNTAFPSTDGIVCRTTTSVVSCKGYELVSDLDFNTGDPSTRTDDLYYNNGAGWTPIAGYATTFRGNDYVIRNLFIWRPGERQIGLFGHLNNISRIEGVGLRDVRVEGYEYVGGLVGYAGNWWFLPGMPIISTSHVTGTVRGRDAVGGLVGRNRGEITASYATGAIRGRHEVGGLVGENRGEITASYATGAVRGRDWVGGLVGDNNQGEISASSATGAVRGRDVAGGLVGRNRGEITASYATGAVRGIEHVGGLVGNNYRGEIAASYATGAVRGMERVGGLAGENGQYYWGDGEIATSYAMGTVRGTTYVGGLVGRNLGNGEIAASYATGAVRGIEHVGGLVGDNYWGEIAASYATGAVRGRRDAGGLVGKARWWGRGTVTASYWDTLTSGRDSSADGTGKKTFELRAPTTYTGIYAAWNVDVGGDETADAPWGFGTGTQYPTLRYDHGTASVALQQSSQPVISADSSLRGLSVGGAALLPDFRAAVTSYRAASEYDVVTVTALVADAGARAEISPGDVQSDVGGHQVRLAGGTTSTITVTVTAADGSATEYVVVVSHEGAAPTLEDTAPVFGVVATTLTYVAGALVDETLPAARGGDGELRYTLMDGLTGALTNVGVTQTLVSTPTLPPDLEFDPVTRRLHGRLTTASSTSRYTLAATDGDENLSLTDAARMFIAIVVLPDHDANRNGLIEVSSLEQLDAIRWDLDGDGVPARSGVALYSAAFPSVDGIVCRTTTGTISCKGYELVSDLDFNTGDASTRTDDLYYNDGAGWEPIGTCDLWFFVCLRAHGGDGYTATFRGNGHVIDNLFIRRPGEDHIGLFGYLADGSRIEGLGLRDVSVVGGYYVGGLAGGLYLYDSGSQGRSSLRGEITASYVAGEVSGIWYVGGLVGNNDGEITASYATAAVSGGYRIGGLVGENQKGGEITASYATGAVRGTQAVGGLVGGNRGEIVASYATGAVSGRTWVGGLAGDSWGEIAASYATGAVSGRAWVGGLVGENEKGGEIAASYATGAVRGTDYVGGLVGGNDKDGEIAASYAAGAVSGTEVVGGFVGDNGGEIVASYATGAVSGERRVGGLAGYRSSQWAWRRWWRGTVTTSYWDTLTSGLERSADGTGKKTFELRSPTTYTGIYAAWNVDVDGDEVADAPWDFGTDTQYPVLRHGHGTASVALQQSSLPMISADGSLRGLSVGGATLSPDFRAAVTSYRAVSEYDVVTVTALVADAGARARISPRDAQSDVDGHQVRLAVGAAAAVSVTVTVTVTAADGSATEYVVMVSREDTVPVFDVAATTLTYVAGDLVDETLPAARGGDGELRYTLTDGLIGALTNVGVTQTLVSTPTLPPDLEFDPATRRLHGRLTTASSTSRYTLTAMDGDGNLSPSDAARMSIAIVVLRDHDANRNGLIEVSSLEQLNAIRWDLDGNGVPTRAGATSYTAAFPSTDGIVCRTATTVVSCKGYELVSDLDFNTGDASTRTDDLYYNNGAGWEPIGTCGGRWWCAASNAYAATFRGNGHVIHNLFIQRPGEKYIGLFGHVNNRSRIERVGLRDVRVEGYEYVGGLVGYAKSWWLLSGMSIISTSHVTGEVNGGWFTGGLVGANGGEITASYATGTVSIVRGIRQSVGGLVGNNSGDIVASYAMGAVSSNSNQGYEAGGLVGNNSGDIVASYATGAVSGGYRVGGLVGYNSGDIVASYAAGAVSGSRWLGGLVGANGGGITASYATGAVGGVYRAGGGLGGGNWQGEIAASYWDTLTSGRAWSAGGTGKKTFELRSPTTYTGIYAAWNVDVDGDEVADAPWGFGTETQYPILRYGHGTASVALQRSSQPVISADGSLRGLSVGGARLSPDFSAAVTLYRAVSEYDVVTVTAVVSDAGAGAEISPEDAQSDIDGHQVRLAADTTSTVTVTVTAADGSETEYVVVVGHEGAAPTPEDTAPTPEDTAPTFDVAATTLTYVAGALVDKTLPAARGGNGELRYVLTDGLTGALINLGVTQTLVPTPTLPPGLEFDAASRRLHGRLTTASSTSRYTLTATDGDGNLLPSDAARMSIAVVVLRNHDANRNGLIEISSLEQLNAIRWDLDGNGVPTQAGATSYTAAFPSVNGIVCRTATTVVSCKGYELVSDLDFNTGDASTRTDDLYYNNGAGWEPIGTCGGWSWCAASNAHAATFRGNGHVIHNLFIQRPGEKYIGLFGHVNNRSRIERVGLRDVRVEGYEYVGGLVGYANNWGSLLPGVSIISTSHVTGEVNGGWFTGGLVGTNGGEITASYATGTVSIVRGTRNHVGGLVGNNSGDIVASYAMGAVSSNSDQGYGAGGLAGLNSGDIVASYATGAVSGGYRVGGLVGENRGNIVASYATGAVSGNYGQGGLVGTNMGEIAASYATGAVSGNYGQGGLVGVNYRGETTTSYWDTLTSGHAWSAGGAGKKTFELRSPTTYTGIYAAWNVDVDGDEVADAPWGFGTETQYPILRHGHGTASVALQQSSLPMISADGSLRGLSLGGATLLPDFRAAVTSYDAVADRDVVTVTALVADAGARARISPRDAQSDVDGHQVRLAAGATGTVSVTVTVTAADGSETEYVVVISSGDTAPTFDVAATTLAYVAGELVDETLPAARGGNGELRYMLTDAGLTDAGLTDAGLTDAGLTDAGLTDAGLTDARSTPTRTLTLPSGLEFDAAARRLHGRLTTASSSARYTLTAADGDGNLSPADAARTSIEIVVTSDHDRDDDGLISITTLAQLNAVRWDLDGDGVSADPGYAAAFPHAGASMGCPSSGCTGYELDNDLDFDTDGNGTINAADGALSWGAGAYAGKGWAPIGPYGAGFKATFMGNGHVLKNLFINRLAHGSVGLFGRLGAGARIEGLGLVGAVVIGDFYVGALVGENKGQIIASYADATVSGRDQAGGLVGRNKGQIIASYANATVSGVRSVGGLVGRNKGQISASYANATVSGERTVGGLVGRNKRRITASYARGTVNGRKHVGGLVGRGGAALSYWDTDVSNLSRSGGAGRTTGELQTPTSYTGIYAAWNLDLDNSTATGAGGRDDPWDFGTSGQYPVLQYRGLSTAAQFAAQPLGDASLRSLAISTGVLEPGFDAGITSYAAVVGYAALVGTGHYLTVTASAAHSSASVALSPADARASVGGHQVRLESGESETVAVVVTAADGISSKIYTLLVAGMPPQDESEPGFESAIASYMAAVRREASGAPMEAYAVAAHQMMAGVATATVRAGVFLQGAYTRAGARMKTTYGDLLPTSQPYEDLAPAAELNFALSEVTRTVVDWVAVELRATTRGIAAAAPETRLDRRAALLLSDGSIVGVDPDAETAPATIAAGNVIEFSYMHDSIMGNVFYVLVHHRNHLSVMTTATGGAGCSGASYCADFRNGPSRGGGQRDMGNGDYAMFAGDTDGDGDIDRDDEAAVRRHNLTAIGATGRYVDAAAADLNFDRDVLSDDRYFILQNGARRACDVCAP